VALLEEGAVRRPPGRTRVAVNRVDMCSTTQLGRGGVWRLLNNQGACRASQGCRCGAPLKLIYRRRRGPLLALIRGRS
jgi:hypothetical protein